MCQGLRAIAVGLAPLATALVLAACSSEPAVQREASESAPAQAPESGSPAEGGDAAAPAGETATVAGSAAAPTSATGGVIQTQETNAAGLVAELIEARRKEGVLTVKVRFHNTGAEHVDHGFDTGHGDYSAFYVTAGDQKYSILKDSEGAPLAPKYLDVKIDGGQTHLWWAKFPAPPAGVRKFNLIIPDVLPFEDVPISDA